MKPCEYFKWVHVQIRNSSIREKKKRGGSWGRLKWGWGGKGVRKRRRKRRLGGAFAVLSGTRKELSGRSGIREDNQDFHADLRGGGEQITRGSHCCSSPSEGDKSKSQMGQHLLRVNLAEPYSSARTTAYSRPNGIGDRDCFFL